MVQKTVMQNNIILKGKFKDLCNELKKMSKQYHTLAEYIKAHLH